MRLDRFLSLTTELTRSQARKLLKSGRVKVNDMTAKSASTHLIESDRVCFDQQQLAWPRHRYLMLNKPQGVVCATEDSQHYTVLDLLPEVFLRGCLGQLHPAGRLDIDTTGLVLISDDGQWTHQVTSPRKQCWKVYHVELADEVDAQDEMIGQFAEGILLQGEKEPTLPAKLAFVAANRARVQISEGRYHQVKRMFAAMGNKVVGLHRDQIGGISLDAALEEGECRELSEEEIGFFNS